MKPKKTTKEAADIIDRFLNETELYAQEWNDFVETRGVEERAEPYRKRCYQLDPLVNRPGAPDANAIAELKTISQTLRRI